VTSATSLNVSASSLLSTLFDLFDQCFPLCVIRLRDSDPPWMKPSVKIIINRRDRAYAEGKWLKYMRLRDEAVAHIKFLKQSYITSTVASRDSRKIWNAVKSLGKCGKTKNIDFPCTAHEMADFFSSICSTSSSPNGQSVGLSGSLDTLPESVFQTSVAEVLRLLKKTKTKSPGPDGVPSWIFKEFALILAPAITFIFNESLRLGRVPECFKSALICPVPKRMRPSVPSHYRPISLLPILSKCLERIVVKHMILSAIQEGLSATQFAYVPGRGAAVAMTLMYDKILRFLDSQSGAVRLLAIDFEKAFDNLPHDRIIKTCIDFNLPKQAVLWISDFLADRRQCVRMNSSFSSWYPSQQGVPQGSILGPLLFCLVMDDFLPVHKRSSVIKYADDLTILHFVRFSDEDQLQSEWENVVAWSQEVGLPINFLKCSTMNVVTKKSITLNSVITKDGPLPDVTVLKILGVHLSSDLKWKVHVDKMVTKATQRLYILRNLRRSGCSFSVLRSAYFAFVRSCILYCCPVLVNMPHYLRKKIVQVEKRASKICSVVITPDFDSAVKKVCSALFENVVKDSRHPLRDLFLERKRFSRNGCPLLAPLGKTERFTKSFIQFCK